ncbi:helix-turn-helix domain-containing protein [Phenylobacterium koreense]|uniref:helix-turn-helix domain-containing protein n=1 Tax=Phenylobacterium koreense TaxID=266125 RepID=UPI00339A92F3
MRRRREGPDHVDILVGQRIRALRRELRLSLEGLAAGLGITHQQMQKYETGGNRITIGMLYQIAVALRVPVESLWDTVPPADEIATLEPPKRSNVTSFLASPDAGKMAIAYAKLPTAVQRRLADLAGTLADHGDGLPE